MARAQPRFAKPDKLKLLVQSVLSDNLVKPQYRVDWSDKGQAKHCPRFEGHCYAASEAYWFLRGGKESGLRTKQLSLDDGGSHRWLETGDGEIIDLTIGADEERKMKHFPYEEGRNRPFITGKGEISVRAQEIVDRVERARERRLT